jgi:hypothetical protein
MPTNRTIARQRVVAALDVLRGRRPRFDYGLLLIVPFVAAAGGVLISLFIEDVVERRRVRGIARSSEADEALAGAPTEAESAGQSQ